MACDSNWIVSKSTSLLFKNLEILLLALITLENFLRKFNNINNELVNFYPVCSQGCRLFDLEDATVVNCQYCESPRYKNPELFTPNSKPRNGNCFSRCCSFRNAFKWKDQGNDGLSPYCYWNHEAGVYKDIFDGVIYRNIYLNEKILQYLGQVKMYQ